MNAAEFTAARERLGWTREDVAAELRLTPAMVDAIERGALRVPRDVAGDLAWRVAALEREELLHASGLPEFPTAAELGGRITGWADLDAVRATLEALECHAAECPRCRARQEFAGRHTPPLPERPLPLWWRAVVRAGALVERLPRGLRLAPGDAGEGRRMGIFMAAAFSLIALAITLAASVPRLASGGGTPGGWREAGIVVALVIPGYFVGFYLAGAAFDVTRPLRHRFAGYVLRGALGATAVYGSVGLVLPLLEPGTRLWPEMAAITLVFGLIGALAGAVLWAKDRLTGRFPHPA